MPSFTVYKGSESGKIVEATTTREVKPHEVLVKITHSGLCGTDEHYLHADMALGHEGVGIVEEIGSEVKNLVKGDSVGWGYLHNCCLECKQCQTGHETLCPQRAMYGYADLDQGSFGTHAVWHSDFLFKIPAGLDRASAAPLMCGGATVFNALQSFGVKSTDRIGVIGIGGLGHLAIQYANKMGCDVVVFSSTESKKEEAMSLGASEFFATKDVKELKIGKPLDALFVTTSQQPDWAQYMPIMAPGSTVFPLTVSDGNLTIPYMPFLAGELRIQGALVAARDVHRTMLEFSARHGIKPIIERFPMSVKGVEDSMEKLRQGKMRYRGVLVAEGEN